MLDLMRLAEDGSYDWADFVAKVYEWEHGRRVEIGKWLLAIAAAMVTAVMTLKAKAEVPPSSLVSLASIGAGASAATGIVTIWSAQSVAARFARTTALMGRLVGIRTFLNRVREDEGL